MKRAIQITSSLAAIATLAALKFGAGWIVGLWIGALWGLANIWCLRQVADSVVVGKSRWTVAGWLALKFVGLYGLAALLLVAAKVSPVAWMVGFTLSLIGFTAGFYPLMKAWMPVALCSLWMTGTAWASEAVHGAAEAAAPAHPPEIPNLITLITQIAPESHWAHFLETWENGIFAFVIVGIVGGLVALGARKLAMLPARGQSAVEAVIEGLDDMVCGVLGKKEGRRYLPFLGTLFLFILSMNLAGLVPGLKSPTSRFEMTGALGISVFAFVQWTGIRRLGIGGYLDHLLGQPRDTVGWILSPLMLFIHGIGEIVKPVSLSLRLFGNIMGEDTLLGVFVTLGALTMAWSHLPIGLPLHLPFVLLAIIFSAVQALVFTSLSMIYIFMMLPHEEHGEAH